MMQSSANKCVYLYNSAEYYCGTIFHFKALNTDLCYNVFHNVVQWTLYFWEIKSAFFKKWNHGGEIVFLVN